MLLDFFITVLGLALMVGGGESLVRGASALANRFGVSALAIGLTVVAFGTSAPELAVNVMAAVRGNVGLSFGNIFGSNMANIGLVIAITALISHPLQIRNIVISREVPMMLLATLVAAALGVDALWGGGVSEFSRGDGVTLLLLFSVFAYYTLRDLVRQREGDTGPLEGAPAPEPPGLRAQASVTLCLLGMAALCIGGAVTVYGAEGLARAAGISETVIGLTLVAIGTSLPELVAAVIATLRGQTDMAVGNVVGSNIFNLLIVLGTTATIRPVPLPAGGGADLIVVIVLSALLWITSRSSGQRIVRTEAILLLTLYFGYLFWRSAL